MGSTTSSTAPVIFLHATHISSACRSCAEALQDSTDVSISDEAVQQLASALDAEQIKAIHAAPGMPFKFDDLKAEVNMMALAQPQHHILTLWTPAAY